MMTGKRSITKSNFKKNYDPEVRYQRKLNPRQKREVKKLIDVGTELYYQVGTLNNQSITTVGSIIGTPFDIAQGITDSDRTGDSIHWCGTMEFRIRITNGLGSTGDVYNNVRCIIFQYHPNTTPTIGTVLLTGASGVIDFLSPYSHDNRQTYKILFDKVFTTVGNNSSASNPYADNVTLYRSYKISLKRATKKVQYVAGTTVGTNRFFIILLSDSSLVTHPTVSYTTKVFYRDE